VASTWQSIGEGPIVDWPLALSDSSTVDRDDLFKAILHLIDQNLQPTSDLYSCFREGRNWYYKSMMTPDDIIDSNMMTTQMCLARECYIPVSHMSCQKILLAYCQDRVSSVEHLCLADALVEGSC